MRILSRETYIRRATTAGKWLTLISLGLLGSSFIVYMTRMEWWYITLTLASLGFICSVFGSYYGDRFAGPLAHHIRIPEALKGFDDDYALLVYQTPAPFVLVEPSGLTVILVKNQGGVVTYTNGKWRHRQAGRFFRQMGGQEALGRPDDHARLLVADVQRYLRKRLPQGVEIPVRAIVVFIAPKVQLDAADSPLPALRAEKVKGWLRGPGRRPVLSAELRRNLAEALDLPLDVGYV